VTTPLPREGEDEYRLAGEMPTIITSGGSVVPSKHTAARPVGTQVTGLGDKASAGKAGTMASAAPAAETETPLTKATRFTTVSESELRQSGLARDSDETPFWQWLAVGGVLTLAVIGLAAGVYFATRAPSADQLYARITSAAEQGSLELAAAADDVNQFLQAHPGDPRAAEVRGYQEDLELDQLERRFELRAKRSKGVESLLPIERAYLEGVQVRSSNPEEALARFEAIVAVYGGTSDPSQSEIQQRASERCLELAKKQVEQLGSTVKQFNQEQRLALRRQLERAGRLEATDRAAAEQIWQGIITLYAGKTWAKDLVEQAQERLENSAAETVTAP
jgi:serine/threonine-protein kinase